jgi:hypothetical protein
MSLPALPSLWRRRARAAGNGAASYVGYPGSEMMLLSLPRAPRNGLRPPRKICGRKNYSKRTTRPIPSRKPSPGRRTTAATAGSPSRPCDRPRLATVTAIALRRLERLAGHNLTMRPGRATAQLRDLLRTFTASFCHLAFGCARARGRRASSLSLPRDAKPTEHRRRNRAERQQDPLYGTDLFTGGS